MAQGEIGRLFFAVHDDGVLQDTAFDEAEIGAHVAFADDIVVAFERQLAEPVAVALQERLEMQRAAGGEGEREVGEVFDTYVYRVGILEGQFSYSAAVGLFKSTVGLVLVFIANRIAKALGEEGIY